MNHLEFAAMESAALEPTPWDKWSERVEKLLGHDLDGNQDENGYSVDGALLLFTLGWTARDAAHHFKTVKPKYATIQGYARKAGVTPGAGRFGVRRR